MKSFKAIASGGSRSKPSYSRIIDRKDSSDDDYREGRSSTTTTTTREKKKLHDDKSSNMESMTRLMDLARPERHLLAFSAIFMAFSSAVSLAVPSFSGKIIDLSIGSNQKGDDEDEDEQSPFTLLLGLLGIMTLSGFFGFFRILWQAQAGHRLVARLRRHLYASIITQDKAFFDATPQGDLISRLASDADLVQSAVTDKALGLLRNVVVSVGAVGLLFYTSISLALISVAILPPIALAARMVGRRMRDRQKQVRELHASATSLVEQALTCITTVQQFVAEEFEVQQYNKAINEAHVQGIQNTKLQALFRSVMQLVVNLALLCVLGYGGMLVSQGQLTPGDLASFVMYSVMMGGNVSGISTMYIDLMKAIAAANRVFEIMDREPAIPASPMVLAAESSPEIELLMVPPTIEREATKSFDRRDTLKMDPFEDIELGDMSSSIIKKDPVPLSVNIENVTFSYPTRSDSKVLNGLNLSIGAGQVLAVVGGSGAGKSTIASLLTRLYDPDSGSIQMGTDQILDLDPQQVRHNVGIVVQEPLLFPTTIEANIRYGSPHATEEQVREAARLAFVLDFADKFPEGLQTVVGARGTQLSGGQKQRVAVARCILKNPPIVIFDEATSALDAESESQVQRAIDTACQGRTVIMIAHRLSTIRNADTIAVLRDGQVSELGSFDELMEKQAGAFRQLMEKQLVHE
uniref:ABC transporter n=1 Tax=Pseudictyota dubia TaxID=2749911 RepID=A0A7R9W9X8_9STRA|eukprot:CAMPEP_0197455362 /NCGR_PEP_ID=MMETSP1175-20131217/40592_1 /TAXON_ID=1003142 /ORGANISM="Triceratium dubium, Strain CCMP147" /LENGTH=691 /DNA_ID=CAMNT_0042989203 /DNA_START=30 /DNA_END=2105 /DNA_ORIENTATION=+